MPENPYIHPMWTGSYSKVELNRLIRSGVKFTISTVRTPAVLMDIMKGVELQLPVIVTDGAALYDVKGKRYLETVFLPSDVSSEAEKIISDCGICSLSAFFLCLLRQQRTKPT